MARIYLIRHGQTAWNKQQIFRGRKDLPLSDHGHAQARAVGERLAQEGITAVFASPMTRAVQTVTPLAETLGMEIERVEGLIDADFGAWQGKTVPDVKEQYPDLYALWERSPHRVAFPGGETTNDVAARATSALRDLAENAGDRTIAVVAHRFVNKVILCSLLGILETGFYRIKQDTACINTLLLDGDRLVIESLNYTDHLRAIQSGAEADF